MCGLFGSIGNNPSEGTLRTLAVLNEERGSHAFGLFSSDSMWIRWAEKATKCLADKSMADWLDDKVNSCWFIAGHTRWATTGSGFKTSNAHPFCYGDTVGAHNGCVDAPLDYEVDSMYLFDMLEKHNQDYQKALEDISGYFTITWTDGQFFYILSYDNELHLAKGKDGVWYYSSDLGHLEIALGPLADDKVTVIDSGKVMRFEMVQGLVELTVMDEFSSIAGKRWGLSASDKSKGKPKRGQYQGQFATHYPTECPTSGYDNAGLDGLPGFSDGGLDAYYERADHLNDNRIAHNDDMERLNELSDALSHVDPNDFEYDDLWDEYMELVDVCKEGFDTNSLPLNIHSMTDQEYMDYEMRCNNHFDGLTEKAKAGV